MPFAGAGWEICSASWSWHGFTTSGLSGVGETVLFGEGTEICRGVKLRQQYPSLAEGNKNSAER